MIQQLENLLEQGRGGHLSLTTTAAAGGLFYQLPCFALARTGFFQYMQQAEQLLQQYHIELETNVTK